MVLLLLFFCFCLFVSLVAADNYPPCLPLGGPMNGCCINALGIVGCFSSNEMASSTTDTLVITGSIQLPNASSPSAFRLASGAWTATPVWGASMNLLGSIEKVNAKIETLSYTTPGRNMVLTSAYLTLEDPEGDYLYYYGLLGIAGPSLSFRPTDCRPLPGKMSGLGYLCARTAKPAPPDAKLNAYPLFVAIVGADKGLAGITYIAPFADKASPSVGSPDMFSYKFLVYGPPGAGDKLLGGVSQVEIRACSVVTDPEQGMWVVSCRDLAAGFAHKSFGPFIIPLNNY